MEIVKRLEWYLNRVQELGGFTRELRVDKPATEEEVLAVEKELGYEITEDFRRVLLNFSSHLEFYWSITEVKLQLPDELRNIFCGELSFGLDCLLDYEIDRKGWIENVYPDYDNEYDRVYHNKLAFQHVRNGDYIAIDLEKEGYGNIVYLSHDGDDMHGYVLAHSFTDFLEQWTKLGCVGGECWQMEPFTNNQTTTLDSECENAKLWLKTIGHAKTDESRCRICGCDIYPDKFWEGDFPTYIICPCCGAESGYEDCTQKSIENYRQKWKGISDLV